MSKFILLVFFSFGLFAADDHATISLQRWNKKLVVTIDHDSGWHTYWKNPGDAGIASSFKFSPDDLKSYEWPVPKRHIEEGDILTIGYSGRQHFFFEDYAKELSVHIGVLICKDICIPGEATLKLAFNDVFTSNRKADAYSEAELQKAFDALPQPTKLPPGLEFYLTRVKDQNLLTLHYSLKGMKNPRLPHELLFLTPFPQAPFGFKREKLFHEDGVLYGKTEIEWDGEYQEPAVNLPTVGPFPKTYELKFLLNEPGSPAVKIVTLPIKDFSLATPALDDFYKKLKGFDGKSPTVVSGTLEDKTYLEYLLLAFLGGLILNLMPCVLPVISLKLFGLMKHQNYSRKKLLSHNLSYTLGVLSTFLALAGIIVALKASGEEVGWGFQLQSPAFILGMMVVLFILSLNLFGLFEFMTPMGSTLGSKKTEDSFAGDFFSGVLTTILSTPCSAPFLGTALTFAFTTSTLTIFIMFLSIGLGLSFPFLLTALFPQSLSLFPKPGAWMEKLKYFLGLSLVVTVVWLYDVLVSLVDFNQINWKLNLLLVLWFFAFFFVQKISQKKFLRLMVFILPFSLTIMAMQDLQLKELTLTATEKKDSWQPWSESRLQEEKGKLVFMDFTAEWCLTCKVNKKLVLETDGFKKLQEKYELVLMRADWTKRDDNITQYLKRHHTVGVPAYFIQQKDGNIISLGETISLSKIENKLH